MFRLDNKFMQAMGTVGDLLILSFYWIILSITLVGFGPATTAGYYVCAKSIRRNRGHLSKEFFQTVKRNWWPAMVAGLLVLLFGFFLYKFDSPYIFEPLVEGSTSDAAMFIQATIKLIIFFFITIYVFPLISRFEVKLGRALITSIMLAIRHFGRTLLGIILLCACFMLFLSYPAVGWIGGGFYMYLLTFPMEKVLAKYIPQDDPNDANEDKWYLEN